MMSQLITIAAKVETNGTSQTMPIDTTKVYLDFNPGEDVTSKAR